MNDENSTESIGLKYSCNTVSSCLLRSGGMLVPWTLGNFWCTECKLRGDLYLPSKVATCYSENLVRLATQVQKLVINSCWETHHHNSTSYLSLNSQVQLIPRSVIYRHWKPSTQYLLLSLVAGMQQQSWSGHGTIN